MGLRRRNQVLVIRRRFKLLGVYGVDRGYVKVFGKRIVKQDEIFIDGK